MLQCSPEPVTSWNTFWATNEAENHTRIKVYCVVHGSLQFHRFWLGLEVVSILVRHPAFPIYMTAQNHITLNSNWDQQSGIVLSNTLDKQDDFLHLTAGLLTTKQPFVVSLVNIHETARIFFRRLAGTLSFWQPSTAAIANIQQIARKRLNGNVDKNIREGGGALSGNDKNLWPL